MKRTAFSMLELIFVIVVIGLLAVLSIPNFDRNPLDEAAEQVANHIRYTQHLAMVDDRFDPTNPQWYSQMWTMNLKKGGDSDWYYEIFSDRDADGKGNEAEEATDPLSGQSLGDGNGTSVDDAKNINLTAKYEINNVQHAGGSSNTVAGVATEIRITFDSMGRPYRGVPWTAGQDYRQNLMTTDMNITLTDLTGATAVITIRPETGYVCIIDNSTGRCKGIED